MPEVPRDHALLYATKLDDAVPEGHPVRHVLSSLQSEQVWPVISRLSATYSLGAEVSLPTGDEARSWKGASRIFRTWGSGNS